MDPVCHIRWSYLGLSSTPANFHPPVRRVDHEPVSRDPLSLRVVGTIVLWELSVVMRAILKAGHVEDQVACGLRYTGESVTSLVFADIQDDRIAHDLHAVDAIQT